MYAFLLSLISGIATLIGFFFIYINKNKNTILSTSLGFASGVMLTISIIDLIPNSFILLVKNNTKLYTILLIIIGLMIGIILSSAIDKVVEKKSSTNIKLYKLGIITMFVIILHNLPEGIVTYITSKNNINLGITLAIAIALHNIPEGISISIPVYYSTNSKFKAFFYTLISGMSEPLGAFISYIFLYKYINNTILAIVYSIIAGMMINISINELYIESIEYNRKYSNLFFIIGCTLMIINHIMFN